MTSTTSPGRTRCARRSRAPSSSRPRIPAASFRTAPLSGRSTRSPRPSPSRSTASASAGRVHCPRRSSARPERCTVGRRVVLDELLGAVNACLGLGAFTGTLTIRYELPTPISTELEMERWFDRTEGRKVFTVGTISVAGELTAQCRRSVHPRPTGTQPWASRERARRDAGPGRSRGPARVSFRCGLGWSAGEPGGGDHRCCCGSDVRRRRRATGVTGVTGGTEVVVVVTGRFPDGGVPGVPSGSVGSKRSL